MSITIDLPQEAWNRFHSLVEKRDARIITDVELAELIELTDSIEVAHAQRMKALVEVALLQNKPLEELMKELGISPKACESDQKN